MVFGYMRKQRINNQEKIEIKNRYDQTLLKTKLEIQEQTINYIGNEIHDNIGHIIYFVRLKITQLPDIINDEYRDELDNLLKKSADDLRALSHSLNENQFHQIGFYESLKHLLFNIEKTGKYRIELDIDDDIDIYNLPIQSELILFRMMQEIVHNIIKHASASTIKISVSAQKNLTKIVITDNGIGFNLSKTQSENKGIGINNIMSRAKYINATVNINSNPNNGTIVNITINHL